MDEFLKTKLISTDNDDWTDKIAVTRLWMSTSRQNATDESIPGFLKLLFEHVKRSLSASAARAAHIVSKNRP